MFQQVTLIGNLGNDPELRYTPNGTPYANFRMAVNKRWTGADGQNQEKTTWFNISTWRRQAEICVEHLAKGRRVMVLGEIDDARAWMDKDGNPRASVEITAQQVKFLDSRNGSNLEAQEAHADSADDASGDVPF